MSTGILTIDLGALVANYRALDAMTAGETAAVVKADGYGLGAGLVAQTLAKIGARTFFVATAAEGATIRAALGPGPTINVFSGHIAGTTETLRAAHLTPMLNSPEQIARHHSSLPGHPFGLQLDTGMHRLGLQPGDWPSARALAAQAALVMSHLACADEPTHPLNAVQLARFGEMTADISAPRSLSATGGTLLGADYHFDLTRPGIGLYGGLPFASARAVIRLSLPVVQIRDLAPGDTVGYAASFTAETPRRIATLASGYADGLPRTLSNKATLWHGATPCPLVGRVSMDLLTVDVTDCATPPDTLDLIGPDQSVDDLASIAGTIGYEILTSLGCRYQRMVIPA